MKQVTDNFYCSLINRFRDLTQKNNLINEEITITGKTLTPKEALGNPDRKDFPLLTGKERLMEAEIKGAKGQAFTDMPGNFSGKLKYILEKKPENNFDRAVLISSVNAVCRYLGIAEKTIHCRNNEPEKCAEELAEFIREKYGEVKILVIGYQPSILAKLTETFEVRNLDLDPDKIGMIKHGIPVENGIKDLGNALQWSELILATGSTVVNATVMNYIGKKPVWFYGTTIAGTAELMDLNRFCFAGI